MEKKSKFSRFLTRVGALRLSQIWDKFRKPFNVCWKVGMAAFALVFVIQLAGVLIDTCKDHLGLTRYFWKDESLGKNIEIRYFSNNQCATYNRITDERMSPKVRWISGVPERDSLTVFCDKEGRRGYLNVNTGRVVIDGQYKHAWHFSEGLAAVMADNGKVGFINYDNEMVIPAVYDYVADYDYLFLEGVCVIPDGETEKYGAIDRNGELKLPMEYSCIFKAYADSAWCLSQGDRCGLADADLNIIFEPAYDDIIPNSQEKKAYLVRDGMKQLVSFDGKVIMPFVIDDTWPLKYIVKYNEDSADEYALHPYLLGYTIGCGHCGVLDSRTGKVVVPAIYLQIGMISEDLILAGMDGGNDANVLFTTSGVMVKNP